MPMHAPLLIICVEPDIFWNVINVLSLINVDTTGCAGIEELFDHIHQIPSSCIYEDLCISCINRSSAPFITTLQPGSISCL